MSPPSCNPQVLIQQSLGRLTQSLGHRCIARRQMLLFGSAFIDCTVDIKNTETRLSACAIPSCVESALRHERTTDALVARRYDFSMGSKLAAQMKLAGFHGVKELSLNDRELSFNGPASREILDPWGARFDRMKFLQATVGNEFEGLRKDSWNAWRILSTAQLRNSPRIFMDYFRDINGGYLDFADLPRWR